MINISLIQYSRPLVETMHISRGGFTSRTHNILSINYKGHDFFSEVIGDSSLIRYLISKLFKYLSHRTPKAKISDIFEGVNEWINSFVYLESHSSVNSIGCAFNWLKVITNAYFKNLSIFEILSLPEPKRKYTKVYRKWISFF